MEIIRRLAMSERMQGTSRGGAAVARRLFCFLAAAATAFMLSSCAYRAGDSKLALPSKIKIERLLMEYDVAQARAVVGAHERLSYLHEPTFLNTFADVGTALLQHNGMPGRAVAGLQGGDSLRSYRLLVRPEALEQGGFRPSHMLLTVALLSPEGSQLGKWQQRIEVLGAGIPSTEFGRGLSVVVNERAVAHVVLFALRVLQESGAASLRFDPPQTMAGAINPHFGPVR
jgi:hypothetical protein